MRDGGESTCPICNRTWLVTMYEDCLLPACGCYGEDTGPDNQHRPCHSCGLEHAFSCPKMGLDEKTQRELKSSPVITIDAEGNVVEEGPEDLN